MPSPFLQASVRSRIQAKLSLSDEELAKWKLALVSFGRVEYLEEDDEVVKTRFRKHDNYGNWDDYLGLEHQQVSISLPLHCTTPHCTTPHPATPHHTTPAHAPTCAHRSHPIAGHPILPRGQTLCCIWRHVPSFSGIGRLLYPPQVASSGRKKQTRGYHDKPVKIYG